MTQADGLWPLIKRLQSKASDGRYYAFEDEDRERVIAYLILYATVRAPVITNTMIEAAIEAAWPGPEIIYADEHDSAETMMRAALVAALAVTPHQGKAP